MLLTHLQNNSWTEGLGNIAEERLERSKSQRIREFVPPSDVRSYTYQVLLTWPPKQELNKTTIYTCQCEWRKYCEASTQPKEYKQLRKAENGRNSLPHRISHQLVIQYQLVSPEKRVYKQHYTD